MKFAANYEIKSDCSIIDDDLVLKIKHPKGSYRVRIQNIQRSVYTVPFLLSLHLYFEAPAIKEAQDIADEHLADCLNMLAFTTGAKFKYQRIRQIVEAKSGMTSLLMWSDSIEYEDPQPYLNKDIEQAVEKLLEFDIPPAIRRAMRWYRLGINATVPDDQFMNFWFALEIAAEFQKSTEKVPDRCPKCQTPLYCNSCQTNPVHKPYARQAIRALLKSVDKDCDDQTIERLDKTRNSLMHGSTLQEIEDSLPQPHEQIVDVLGCLLWKALIHHFPKEFFDGKLIMGFPSTFLHRKINAIMHLQTVVPAGTDGDLDLSFSGLQAKVEPFGPPQSAQPIIISMSPDQHKRLGQLRPEKKEHKEMCQRIFQRMEEKNGRVYAMVLSTDNALIKKAIEKEETGAWQDLFREIYSVS